MFPVKRGVWVAERLLGTPIPPPPPNTKAEPGNVRGLARIVASKLGVNHYLGKPYSEEELLALIARYCTAPV